MKIKNIKLEWYALYYDFNKKKVEWFNVLSEELKEDIAKQVRKGQITNLDLLKDYIDREFKYYYWSKVEYEVAVSDLFEDDFEKAEKVDVYSQLEPNLDRIVEYINNKMDLKLEGR